MSNEDSPKNHYEALVKVGTEMGKEAAGPAAKELGQAAGELAKEVSEVTVRAVKLLLAPVKGLLWTGEQIQEWVDTKVARKLEDVPEEHRQSPSAHVAAPALQAMTYTGEHPELAEMFANLLTTAMDSRVAARALPSFVECLKQLSPDEAKLVQSFGLADSRYFPVMRLQVRDNGGFTILRENLTAFDGQSKLDAPELMPVYLSNLERLNIIRISYSDSLSTSCLYDPIRNAPDILALSKSVTEQLRKRQQGGKVALKTGVMNISPYGESFIKACCAPDDNGA